jgi:hypothetical protein
MLSAAGLGLLAAFAGCSHMGGKCDCDQMPTITCPCAHPNVVVPNPPAKAEPIKEPIKELPKGTPDKE